MRVFVWRFNLFLALLAAAAPCGCGTTPHHQKEPVSTFRVYIQSPALGPGTRNVSVLRSDPILITVSEDPILTEANVAKAKVFNAQGGFAIDVQFDETGGWMLEQYSAANPGKHFVIYAQWEGKDLKLTAGRWLAVPLISHRISNGILSFTPDMTLEEADKFVTGLNNVVKQNSKGQLK